MIYVTEHKEYSFIFSAMLVYGAYQLIEFSAVQQAGAIVYALLGFVFLAIPKFMEDDHALKESFVIQVLLCLCVHFCTSVWKGSF